MSPRPRSQMVEPRLYPRGNIRWGVRKMGCNRCTRLFDSREQALAQARVYADKQKVNIVVFRENGTLEYIIRYGSNRE